MRSRIVTPAGYGALRANWLLDAVFQLDVPTYALKRLVNHNVSNDMTGRYLILDIERLRVHMSRITSAFLDLLGVNDSDMREWKPVNAADLTEVTQLAIPLVDVLIK
jgi:hypothetical protein